MKKQIPKFKSLEEERSFWNTHSITDYIDELTPAKVKFSRPKKKKLISLRLDSSQIENLKEIASKRGLGYLTLIRLWITQHLLTEYKNSLNHSRHIRKTHELFRK